MKIIIMMYVTLFPTIIAGVLNMVWCKSSILKKLNTPVDFKKNFNVQMKQFANCQVAHSLHSS